MRRENYMIGLIRHKIVNLPYKHWTFTRSFEWAFWMALQIHPSQNKITRLKERCILLIVIYILFMPFILLYITLHTIVQYGDVIYNSKQIKGISYFKDLAELNQKESPRLKWGAKILSKMGIKTITTDDSIKIFGNPNLEINKKIIIKDYLKDHRVFMTSVIAGLIFGGTWNIHDKDSIKTSFPTFLDIIHDLKK